MTSQIFIIDTNVFVAGLISSTPASPTVKILDAMISGLLFYVLSPALLKEYRDVLMRPKLLKLHMLSENDVDQLLCDITANAIWREPEILHQAPDSGDNHIWNLLLQTDDTILVTGDQLLLNNASREPLIKSWMNSLSPDFPIAALASTCNSPAITSAYRLALENSESQSASPRLDQRLPKEKSVITPATYLEVFFSPQ